ncbi:bacteriohemerythrin [Geobacter sp. FeAm09]|uniref:bacteriohemerythrin n=1 Tax=Geobacter sp. FeAm09 TaxID=2597769 RepID=UPI0011EF47D4|nr:bacteriohemerythrin [Geobacter sp. FeAm09]QEM69361.1 bacteriohemerythrin [Geobacter sp. FeAm09]
MGIAWRESLAIGVPEIDNQHKELLSRFDSLLKACETGKGMDELRRLLGFLDEYVISHFSDEEAIQRSSRYPAYAAHKQEHDGFIVRVKALKDEIKSEGVAVHHVTETNNMLLKWLINHISKVDAELGKYLRATGAP